MPQDEPKECPPHDWGWPSVDTEVEVEKDVTDDFVLYTYYTVVTLTWECNECGETDTDSYTVPYYQEKKVIYNP